MADAFKKIISENDYVQGSAIVHIPGSGTTDNRKLAPDFNKISDIPGQTGILDTRLDDVRYYTGDSA